MEQEITNLNVVEQLRITFYNALNQIVAFLPDLVAGLAILLVGWLVASALKVAAQKGLDAVGADKWLDEAGIRKKSQKQTWIELIASLVYWTVFIIFLIPALEAWNLLGATDIINRLVAYLPNVLASIIVGFVGFIFARLASQLVSKAARDYGKGAANILSAVARWSILIFTGLIVLNQLGIAPALIQIFFGALMFALALAAGLAFGLGGREAASRMLNSMSMVAKKK